MTPVRNSIAGDVPLTHGADAHDEAVLPGATPDWSGCSTIDGLNRAAASTAYSWLK